MVRLTLGPQFIGVVRSLVHVIARLLTDLLALDVHTAKFLLEVGGEPKDSTAPPTCRSTWVYETLTATIKMQR